MLIWAFSSCVISLTSVPMHSPVYSYDSLGFSSIPRYTKNLYHISHQGSSAQCIALIFSSETCFWNVESATLWTDGYGEIHSGTYSLRINVKRNDILFSCLFKESYTYKDPITEFVECLYVNFDFDGAQKKLRECESVSSICTRSYLLACLQGPFFPKLSCS